MGAPKKILFTSTEDNQRVSTLVRLLSFGQQRTDSKSEDTWKAKTQEKMIWAADTPTINPC